MSRVFWDTHLFIYLFESFGPLSKQVAALGSRVLARQDQLLTSTMTRGEILVKPNRSGDAKAVAYYQGLITSTAVVVPFEDGFLRASTRCDPTCLRVIGRSRPLHYQRHEAAFQTSSRYAIYRAFGPRAHLGAGSERVRSKEASGRKHSARSKTILSLPFVRRDQEYLSMEMKIRRASAEDLKHILHHRLAMFEEMGFCDGEVLDRVEAVSREYFAEALKAGTYLGWMVEDPNGKVIGGGGIVVAAWPGFPGENHAKRAWILNMYTEPGARRCGVARRLMQAMVEWCRGERYSLVSLHASEAGRPLYEGMGFRPSNEMTLKIT